MAKEKTEEVREEAQPQIDIRTLNVHQRILAVSNAVSGVEKKGRNQAQKWDYTKVDDIVAALRPHLARFQIRYTMPLLTDEVERVERGNSGAYVHKLYYRLFIYCVDKVERGVKVEDMDPADMHSVPIRSLGIDQIDKGPMKGQSYALKTLLTAEFMLQGNEDVEEGDIPMLTGGQQPPRNAGRSMGPSPRQQRQTGRQPEMRLPSPSSPTPFDLSEHGGGDKDVPFDKLTDDQLKVWINPKFCRIEKWRRVAEMVLEVREDERQGMDQTKGGGA